MVLFRHILIEKNRKVISLNNLNLNELCQVMSNGGWNAVNLKDDRNLFYDSTNIGKYGDYDVNVLNNSNEIFDRVILFKCEKSKIEESVSRKNFLLTNMFDEKKPLDRKNETTSYCANVDQQTNIVVENKIDEPSSIEIKSIVNLNDYQACELLFTNLNDLPNEQFILDELEDDPTENQQDENENKLNVSSDENQQTNLSYLAKCVEQILLNQQIILTKLDKIERRLTVLEQGFALFYEKHSAQRIIQLLSNRYLIDIQDLDRRILSSFQSKEMKTFFRFVATQMKQDYSHRWNQMDHKIPLSLCPKSIEFNLLGFGQSNKVDQKNKNKSINSPIKSTNIEFYRDRCSYASFPSHINANTIVVFEATISQIIFMKDTLCDLDKADWEMIKPMRTLIYKMCQLERQIFYLSFYYSISLHQFFCGLVLFQLYRDPTISQDGLLIKLMSSNKICQYVPLLSRLYKMNQFIITY